MSKEPVKAGDVVSDGHGSRGRVTRVDNPHAVFVDWYLPPPKEDPWTPPNSCTT